MAKSSWKFFNFSTKDVYFYLDEYKLPLKYLGLQYYGNVSNSFKLNTLNYMHTYKFYLGKSSIMKKFSIFNLGQKGKEFLKFTKPFHFKSKKKKK